MAALLCRTLSDALMSAPLTFQGIPRPLTCAILLALASAPTSTLSARELNNEHVSIESGHAVEEWRLINGSTLAVRGASTYALSINDTSVVMLADATVTRQVGSMSNYAMMVLDDARATATRTHFVNRGIWVADRASAVLVDSTVTVAADAPGMDDNTATAWGFSLNKTDPGASGIPALLLDGTSVSVADRADQSTYSSGIGAFMRAGELTVRNGSQIHAANTGVVAHGSEGLDHTLKLTLDGSHIDAGRGAGIEFAGETSGTNAFDVLVANGSTINAGDGHLLLVRAYKGIPGTGESTVSFTVDNSRLNGDIRFDDTHMQGRVDVVLRNQARLAGRFFNVSTARIESGSHWTLTGDSDIGELHLGNGHVALGDGSAFNTLALGSFSGTGGTLVFNTTLGDDGSATDRLWIAGDASGQANVRVNNAGGLGAQTAQGIELITIGGASNARFDLVGRAVGGQFEYFLHKGVDGNWYLRSQVIEDPGLYPDPCDTDPSLCDGTPEEPGGPDDPDGPDEPPTPVLRPETGAYLANRAAVRELMQHRAQGRAMVVQHEDDVRTWASVDAGGNRMQAAGQQALRTEHTRLQAGVELGAFDGGRGHLGVMLGAGRAAAMSRSRITGYRARGTAEGGTAGVYAGWSNGSTSLHANLQHGRFNNVVRGEGLARERYRSRASQATLEAAYRIDAGHLGGMALGVQPHVQLRYTRDGMDMHLESNGTEVEQARDNVLSAGLGIRLQGELERAALRWQPYVSLGALQTGKVPALTFDDMRVEGGAPRRQVELAAGSQLRFGTGVSASFGLSAGRGSDNYRDITGTARLAIRW